MGHLLHVQNSFYHWKPSTKNDIFHTSLQISSLMKSKPYLESEALKGLPPPHSLTTLHLSASIQANDPFELGRNVRYCNTVVLLFHKGETVQYIKSGNWSGQM